MVISRRSFLGAGTGALALGLAGPEALGAEMAQGARGVRPKKWADLAAKLHGDLILPSDASYLNDKQLALLNFTTNPRAIAFCADAADVALCLDFAQDHHLSFAVRSGGHSFAGYSTSKGLVIDVSRLNQVALEAGTATVGAGAQLIDITSTLAASGLTVPGGAHPTTGAGGFLQGGGIGLLTRSAGIASDTVVSAKVLLSNGKQVQASATDNPDLFWALRGGGGGNFGVVTEFTLRPLPSPLVNVTTLVWAFDQAVEALHGYVTWLAGAPRTIGGAIRVVLGDSAPGKVPTVAATLVSVGTAAELAAEVTRLTDAVGVPAVQAQTNTLPYSALIMGVYGCAPYTVPQCHLIGHSPEAKLPRTGFGAQRSRLFSKPPRKSVWDRAAGVFDRYRTAGHAHNLEVLAMGGAANDPAPQDTAFVHRDTLFTADFLVQAAQPAGRAQGSAGQAWVDAGFRVIDAASNGGTYQNFVDAELRDWRRSYYGENYPRLVRVKKTYDKARAFDFPQAIGS